MYDNLGNRAVATTGTTMLAGPSNFTPQTSLTSSPPPNNGANWPCNPTTNQWAAPAAAYDQAGNMTGLRTQSMTYDAESRLTGWSDSSTGATASIVYDGDGRRVSKTTSTTGTTVYVYDPTGNLAVEYGGPAPTTTGTQYLSQDHLGSTRLVTNVTNATTSVLGCHDYLPFGEQIPAGEGRSVVSCYGQTDTNIQFTGQERDPETAPGGSDQDGFDNFLARMMASGQGRFLSPDPEGVSASIFDPQRWNGYSYAVNSPMVFVDRNGENPLLAAALTGAIVGAAGGAIGDVLSQLTQNGANFSAINRGEVGAAALGGLVSGGLAGLTLGLLPTPAVLTTNYLLTSAAVNGGANAVGGAVQREANDILDVPQNSNPADFGAIAKDIGTGAVGGAAGTKIAYVLFPLPNVKQELALIANSSRRSLRAGKVAAFQQYANLQEIGNMVASAVTGTAVANTLTNILPSWLSFITFGLGRTPVVTSTICYPTENGIQICQ